MTRYEWDALLRMVKTIAADGGETRYAYDREDNLVSSTDPEGATTHLLLDTAYRETGASTRTAAAGSRRSMPPASRPPSPMPPGR